MITSEGSQGWNPHNCSALPKVVGRGPTSFPTSTFFIHVTSPEQPFSEGIYLAEEKPYISYVLNGLPSRGDFYKSLKQ